MGRDMLKRTVAGLFFKHPAGASDRGDQRRGGIDACIAGVAWRGLMDSLVCGLINLVMGIPHMLLLILISYSLGKGFRGVAAGIALTHWASLTEAFAGGNLTDPGKSVCADLRKTGEKALVDCLEPHRPAGIAAICDRVNSSLSPMRFFMRRA